MQFREASDGGRDCPYFDRFAFNQARRISERVNGLENSNSRFDYRNAGSKAPSQWCRKFCGGGTAMVSLASGELPYALVDAMAHNMVTFFSPIIFVSSTDYLNRIFAIIPLSS